MAQVCITIDDAKLDRVAAALAFRGGRRPNDPTPLREFARGVLVRLVAEIVRDFEVQEAVLTAGRDAAKRVDDEIEID